MPSSLVQSTKQNMSGRNLAKTLDSVFKRSQRVQTGIYLGHSRVAVGGQEYQLVNTSDSTLSTGDTIQVQNIGRKASAIYAPTDLPYGLVGGGGGGGGGSSATLDHTHSTTLGDGGSTLALYLALTGGTLTGNLTLPNTGLHLFDTDATHDLIIAPGSNLTADRTLTLTTGDADRTLTLSGDTTLAGGTH